MPDLKFHPDVAVEIKASFDWYQKQADGLGDDFLNELESAYQASNEFVYVVAVMHNSRKPEYWLKRT